MRQSNVLRLLLTHLTSDSRSSHWQTTMLIFNVCIPIVASHSTTGADEVGCHMMYRWYLFLGSIAHTQVCDCCCYYCCCCCWTYDVCTCLLMDCRNGLTPLISEGCLVGYFRCCCTLEVVVRSEPPARTLLSNLSTFSRAFFHAATAAFCLWPPKYIFSTYGRACFQARSTPDSWLTYSNVINYIMHECSQTHIYTPDPLYGSDRLSERRLN